MPLPSGDQSGWIASIVEVVTRFGVPPVTGTV